MNQLKKFIFENNNLEEYVNNLQGKIYSLNNLNIITFNDRVYDNILSDFDRHLRGLIYNNVTKELVSISYPCVYNVISEGIKLNDEQNKLNPGEYLEMYPLHDGTLIRLTFYRHDKTLPEGKWIMSTNNKIDAYDSKWNSSLSFGELFSSIVNYEQLINNLNKNYIYIYLLCHKDNPIVVKYDETVCYHYDTLLNPNQYEFDNETILLQSLDSIKLIEDSSESPLIRLPSNNEYDVTVQLNNLEIIAEDSAVVEIQSDDDIYELVNLTDRISVHDIDEKNQTQYGIKYTDCVLRCKTFTETYTLLSCLHNEIGYLICVVSKDDQVIKRYRCESPLYNYIKSLIGKRTINIEIIDLVRSKNIDHINLFKKYYKHYEELLGNIENKLKHLPILLMTKYADKYIRNGHTIKYLPSTHYFIYNILYKKNYKEKRTFITSKLIADELNLIEAELIDKLFNENANI